MVLIYYSIPSTAAWWRQWLLVSFSALLVFYAAPYALFVCIALSIFTAWFAQYLASGSVSRLGYVAALSLPVLTIGAFELLSEGSSLVAKLGVSYFALRSALVLTDSWNGRAAPTIGQILALNLFYPTYSAGPIERAKTFSPYQFSESFRFSNLAVGAARVLIGLFLSSYVAHKLIDSFVASEFPAAAETPLKYSAFQLYIYVIANFLSLYISFTGYSEIAIGTARLFGIAVMENFRLPLLSTSIQEFWQRWHLSLSSVISAYLFKPLVRHTGQPTISIFVTFLIVGLWHNATWQYLVWGAAHGTALALNAKYSKFSSKRPAFSAVHEGILMRIVGAFATISFVAIASGFANAKHLTAAVDTLLRLLGIV